MNEFEDDLIIKRMRITRKNVEEFGTMEGCPGCKAVRLGRVAQAHSEECRNRIETKLMETEEGREKIEKDIQRKNEMMARKMEADERAAKKRRKEEEKKRRQRKGRKRRREDVYKKEHEEHKRRRQ